MIDEYCPNVLPYSVLKLFLFAYSSHYFQEKMSGCGKKGHRTKSPEQHRNPGEQLEEEGLSLPMRRLPG